MEEIKFYAENQQWGEFSNFSLYPIKWKGKVWKTSEHYFQAQKFEDKKYQEKIRNAISPMKAAELGRTRKVKIRRNWDKIKDNVMYEIVFAKFSQHEDLKEILLSTGDSKIIEHTENDSYWGDGGDGSGKNKLGKILMKIRENLK
ncbi:NADAR family protein [Aureivirga sp. CE67]|uniref:NADAR family protein n=1 Tax=Aureivirga sp. CE67 TaxID=1788983 RepID=UPI0018CA5EF5|nr:NADAR family protein [Aureivirga sp. CE67]